MQCEASLVQFFGACFNSEDAKGEFGSERLQRTRPETESLRSPFVSGRVIETTIVSF